VKLADISGTKRRYIWN